MIPKIIHYCWYGRGEKSAAIQMCIESWRKYCPDYEIKEWNEDNSPMHIKWMHEAYKHQKYAFVADYARFYALYHEGGIYMDTDMLLVKPIDKFLKDDMFIGREDEYNANMAIMGMRKGNEYCRTIMGYYDQMKFEVVTPPIITRFLSPKLAEFGLKEENITQQLTNGLMVYNSEYFYPIHYTQEFELSNVYSYQKPNTYAIHLWNKSWTDEFKLLASGEYKLGFGEVKKRFLRTPFLPISYWAKVIKYLGNYIGLWKR